MPLVRSLVFAAPSEDRAWTVNDEYLLGGALLVAPVVDEGATSRSVYLPAGDWVSWDGSLVATGPTDVVVPAPMTELPLFVRLSVSDWAEGGWTADESVLLARRLRDEAGVDLVDCSSGGLTPRQKIVLGPGYQVHFSEQIRREAGESGGAGRQLLTAAVGMITTPEQVCARQAACPVVRAAAAAARADRAHAWNPSAPSRALRRRRRFSPRARPTPSSWPASCFASKYSAQVRGAVREFVRASLTPLLPSPSPMPISPPPPPCSRRPYFPLKAAKALGFDLGAAYPKQYQRGRV